MRPCGETTLPHWDELSSKHQNKMVQCRDLGPVLCYGYRSCAYLDTVIGWCWELGVEQSWSETLALSPFPPCLVDSLEEGATEVRARSRVEGPQIGCEHFGSRPEPLRPNGRAGLAAP